jgi:chromosome segregation ATPase
MLLKRLEIRNVRKIKQAEIDFHGPGLQIIQGLNESGKTTIAQCIAMSMDGPKSFVKGMITQGEEQAEIIEYTDDGLKIRTIISDSVKQTVARLDDSTNRYVNVSGGVRNFLDSICSGLEMPWSMRDMTDAQIIELLKERCGISEKIAEIDTTITDKEKLRTDIGRDQRRMGEIKPVEETKHPDPIDDLKAERDKATETIKWLRGKLDQCEDSIRARCKFQSIEDISKLIPFISEMESKAAAAVKGQKLYTQADVDAMNEKMAAWTEEETKAKNYDDYLEKIKEYDNYTAQYTALTAEIEDLRKQRKKVLSDMKLGVKGLVIGEDNLLYHNGIVRGVTAKGNTSNWSTAESVQVFFTLGARFSGSLKILTVDNAESLDEKNTAAISKWAENAGFLVILLRVASVPENLEEGIIYVKEGEVLTK